MNSVYYVLFTITQPQHAISLSITTSANMGNKASSTATTTTTTAAAAHNCLLSAVNGNTALISFQNDFLYGVTAVHEYNLNFPVTPAAVTFPKTSEQVAAIEIGRAHV